jgi:integrase/recombinase XerD
MGRRGTHTPSHIPGDLTDPYGFPRMVAEFETWMGVHGYSTATVENRRRMLGFFIVWLDERGVHRPADVTRAMVERYQRHLFHYRKTDGDPLTFRSQAQRLLAVRAFYKWAAKQRRVLYNPAAELELPKVERRLPRPALTASEAETVLAVPDISTTVGLRDRAMLEVLYSTGIRRAELAGLHLFDLDADRRTLLIRQGKNKKDRLIPIGARALEWIDRYLAASRPSLAAEPDDGVLFLTVDGTAFSPDRLTQLARDHVENAGVAKQGACHLFRHTMATLMLEGGADIRYVQQMLGHADISTTQIYTQVTIHQLAAIHAATHPATTGLPRSKRPAVPEQSSGVGDGLKVSVAALFAALEEEDQQENRAPTSPATPAPAAPSMSPAEQLVRRRTPNHQRTGHLRS